MSHTDSDTDWARLVRGECMRRSCALQALEKKKKKNKKNKKNKKKKSERERQREIHSKYKREFACSAICRSSLAAESMPGRAMD